MRNRLDTITLTGFKTIRALEDFQPGSITVLIGPNSSGKSNFLSFFRMMNQALADESGFPNFVAQQGGASKLLHDGPTVTPETGAILKLSTPHGANHYCFRLNYAAGDTLIFINEHHEHPSPPPEELKESAHWFSINGENEIGRRFPMLLIHAEHNSAAGATRDFLENIHVFQFNNTSTFARIQTKWNVNDNRQLKKDAANIAAVLLRLKNEDSGCYRRIVDTIQLILPFFSDFDLQPEHGHVLLQWREQNSDLLFDVSQASDGMLRVIALATLLLQPEESLPDLLIVDEPELGLHPYAIEVIAGLISAASIKTQVIIATQSTALVDCFDPEDIVVVERSGRESTFRRLTENSLTDWLEDYSLSELWQKNVIGGRP